jgi:hypothetical protein
MPVIATLYVAVRVDYQLAARHADKNFGVECLGYSEGLDDGLSFLESCAKLDAIGRGAQDQDRDPFYDPENEEGDAPPDSRFVVWDSDDGVAPDDPVLDRPSSVVASISLFSSAQESADRALIRAYKLCKINPVVSDFLETPTEADKDLVKALCDTAPVTL